jgi:hypothetical protein
MKLGILFLSIIFASGLVMVTVYNTMLTPVAGAPIFPDQSRWRGTITGTSIRGGFM